MVLTAGKWVGWSVVSALARWVVRESEMLRANVGVEKEKKVLSHMTTHDRVRTRTRLDFCVMHSEVVFVAFV